MNAPIDIMLPFYGDPGLFHAAVESVLAQTDPDWRLVVIDDRYPDTGPGEWLQGLRDSRIEYHRNEKNLGVSGNFTRCVELAEAPFSVIFGCDDLMLPNYVSRLRSLIHSYPGAAYLQSGVDIIGAAGQGTRPLPDRVKAWYRPRASAPLLLSGDALATSLLRGNWTYFPSICWRTETLKEHGFNAKFDVVLDLALQLDIVVAGGALVVDEEPTFLYRRHNASVSSWKANDGSRFREEREFFHSTAARMRARGWERAARAASHHYSSRLNAVTRLPAALLARDLPGIRSLLSHVLGRGLLRTS